MTQTPAGWHPDPESPGQLRYWDGSAWTEHRAPAAAPTPAATAGDPRYSAEWNAIVAKRRRKNKITLSIVAGVVAFFALLAIIGAATGSGDGDSDTPKTAADSASSPSTSAGASSAAPTKSSSSKPPAPPEQTLQAAVSSTGAKNPKVSLAGGVATVQFDVHDNLSHGLIRTGIAIDTFDMMKAIAGSDVKLQKVAFRGLFPVVDKFGKETQGQVFFTQLRGGDIRQIQYDNIDTTSLDTLESLAIGNIVVLLPDLRD